MVSELEVGCLASNTLPLITVCGAVCGSNTLPLLIVLNYLVVLLHLFIILFNL